MKLFRENKYTKTIQKNLCAVLASTIALSGCASNVNVINVVPTIEPTTIVGQTIEPIETPVVSTIEPTIAPTVEPTPTVEQTQSVSPAEYVFQDLSEEKFNEAYEKLMIENPEEKLNAGSFFTAGGYIDGEPYIMYGTIMPTGDEGVFRFSELFRNQEMFTYHTNNPDGDPRTRSVQENKLPIRLDRVAFEGIHPYFCRDNVELCYVDLSYQACNFLQGLGYNLAGDLDFVNKYIPGSSKETWTMYEYAQSYLNLIPESMWITGEDLELAKTKGRASNP